MGAVAFKTHIPTKRATLYRFADGIELIDVLTTSKQSSTKQFSVISTEVDGLEAILVSGSAQSPSKWIKDITTLTGLIPSVVNSSPGAVLAIRDDNERVWALTWGIGFHFLNAECVDYGFGSRVIARSALPDEIKAITKTVLDHRARVDRSSQPNGSTMRDLGVDGYGEVVSRVDAKGRVPGLSAGTDTIQIRASDSLNLPLGSRPRDLIHDLKVLDSLLCTPVLTGLESVEQLVYLKPREAETLGLETRLIDALELADVNSPLNISWPHERLDIHGVPACFKVRGIGDRQKRELEHAPTIDQVYEWLGNFSRDEIATRLKTIQIEVHDEYPSSGASHISQAVALRRWLTFELREGSKRFCLHDGNWYRMDDKYLDRIDTRVAEILAQKPSITLPPWPTTESEADYNVRAARLLNGYSMDRKLITTALHARGGIEPCDIFAPPGTLIHVKRGKSSAQLSHLLAQALVSTDSLSRDENARSAWKTRAMEESLGVITDADIKEVILGIGRNSPVTVGTLFTFTKVNLVKQYDALRILNVDVRLASIPTS